MILTGPAIHEAFKSNEIEIDPFDSALVNPASYDLRLGDQVAVYTPEEDDRGHLAIQAPTARRWLLDSRRRQNVTRQTMSPQGFIVEPGNLYLMHTTERIHTDKYVTVIDGKSSIGRLGLMVHVTAGYGDPGFDGQYTLEVTSVAHPVVVYPGMLFCQARFHAMLHVPGQPTHPLYDGNYQGDTALGPVRSASWKQFVVAK